MTAAPAQPALPDLPALGPTGGAERSVAIDALRGVALLGILWMNIPWFALSEQVWNDPRADGGFTGADRLVWFLGLFVFDQKMMPIFSALFGAGLMVLSERAAGRPLSLAALYYRRIFWLLLIGLVHGNLIWWGDILVLYAICGVFLYPLRRLSGRSLVVLGLAVASVFLVIAILFSVDLARTRDLAAQAAQLRAEGAEPGPALLAAEEEWDAVQADSALAKEDFLEELRVHSDTPLLLREHFHANLRFYVGETLHWGLWRAGGLMIVGMGLYKLGVFTARRSARFYAAAVALGYSVGWGLTAAGYVRVAAAEGDMVRRTLEESLWNYTGSLFVALAHVGVVMLLVKSGALPRVIARLAAVGRMALTNYIAQSILMTAVFYPWGLGLWSDLDRAELALLILAVWTLQLLWSPWWLARFRFGPMEWLWRSLTYWRRQPMRAAAPAPA